MTKSEQEKLKKTAYHEAGHAVAAFAIGKRFRKASILPEADSLGRLTKCGWKSKLDPELDDSERLRLRRMVEAETIFCLAGAVAEAKLTDRYNHIGASGDYQDAVFYATYVTDSTRKPKPTSNGYLKRRKISFRVVGVPLNCWRMNSLNDGRSVIWQLAKSLEKALMDLSLPLI